jgi:hypothetical protein
MASRIAGDLGALASEWLSKPSGRSEPACQAVPSQWYSSIAALPKTALTAQASVAEAANTFVR